MPAAKRVIEAVLPTVGPPEVYLSAIAFLRGVEESVRGHPRLAALAEAEGAPFVGDEVAEFVSATLIPQIHHQAIAAKSEGDPFVTPRVRGRAVLLAEAANLLERWTLWLGVGGDGQASGPTLTQALGLHDPPANVTVLLTSIVKHLRAQTTGEADLLGAGAR